MADVGTLSSLDRKTARLEEILRSLDRVMVAYSGGVDSAVLAVAANHVLGENAIAVTAVSPSLASGDLEQAAALCQQFGIRHEVLHTHELANPEYARNPPDRCYICRLEILGAMHELAAKLNVPHVVYGQNADDTDDFRPGVRAARERGVRAPLAEVGMRKAEVRQAARDWGIPVWNRPASACLASRFPYGTPINATSLSMVDRAEEHLREKCGYRECRSRHHGDVARIELTSGDLSALLLDAERRSALAAFYTQIGYRRVTVDLQGFRSGSLNEVLMERDTASDGLEQDLTTVFEKAGAGSARWETRKQMLCVQLAAEAFSRLAEPGIRALLIDRVARAGFHYLALDLVPLSGQGPDNHTG